MMLPERPLLRNAVLQLPAGLLSGRSLPLGVVLVALLLCLSGCFLLHQVAPDLLLVRLARLPLVIEPLAQQLLVRLPGFAILREMGACCLLVGIAGATLRCQVLLHSFIMLNASVRLGRHLLAKRSHFVSVFLLDREHSVVHLTVVCGTCCPLGGNMLLDGGMKRLACLTLVAKLRLKVFTQLGLDVAEILVKLVRQLPKMAMQETLKPLHLGRRMLFKQLKFVKPCLRQLLECISPMLLLRQLT
mmetsp:Transcript_74079/g.187902  ORF Transcript_74079/g.187902 Transcript_74079/m.187902 type:complete len:245 (-) Transcript_74079:547-1281(-)